MEEDNSHWILEEHNTNEQHSFFNQNPSNYSSSPYYEDNYMDNPIEENDGDNRSDQILMYEEDQCNEYGYETENGNVNNRHYNVKPNAINQMELNQNDYNPFDQNTFHGIDQINTTITVALESLAQDEQQYSNDITSCEEEHATLTRALSSANANEREELQLLNENFSILTRKNEEIKRLENLNEKIIKTRCSVVNDISDKIQPECKNIFKQLNQNKILQTENKKKINLKYLEIKNQIDCEFESNLKIYKEEIKSVKNNINDIHLQMSQIQNIEQEVSGIQKNIENTDGEIKILEDQKQKGEKNYNSVDHDLKKLEKEIEDKTKEITQKDEKLKEVFEKGANLIENGNIDLNKLRENIENCKKQIQEIIKEQNNIFNINEENIQTLQTVNIKKHKLQLEKLTVQNNIDRESNKVTEIKRENEILLNELKNIVDHTETVFKKEVETLKLNEEKIIEIVTKLDESMEKLNSEFNTLDVDLANTSTSAIENKIKELKEIKETQMLTFDQNIKIIQKQFEDIETHELEIKKHFDEKQEEFQNYENNIKITIEELSNQIENFNIDIENQKSGIVFIKEEMISNENQYNKKIENLRNEQEIINKEVINDTKKYKENEESITQNIQRHDNATREIGQKYHKIQCDLINTQETVRQSVEIETNKKQKINELNEMITYKNNELQNTNFNLEDEQLSKIEKQMSEIKLQIKNEIDNTRKENEMLQKNKDKLQTYNEKLNDREIKKNKFIDEINKTNEIIINEKTSHESEITKLNKIFTEKHKVNLHSLDQMKKSYSNKIIFHSKENERLKQNYEEINNSEDKLFDEIKQCKEKENELNMKIEKKKLQIEDIKTSSNRIKKILEESGYKGCGQFFDFN